MLVSFLNRIQCDQIGRIFAYWAMVFFGLSLKNKAVDVLFGLLFSHCKSYALCNFDKKLLGWVLGDFFTNSPGHADRSAYSTWQSV
jgi:hypothetical protein